MSVYPGALDSFPTHVDNTEYMTAADLNNVQSAVVAIETILGLNPQGAYATVVAWLNALNTAVAGGVALDTAAADIRPVGTTAAAGGIGKGADAGHIHVGVTSIAVNGGTATSGALALSIVTSLNVNGGGAQSGALNVAIPQINTNAANIKSVSDTATAGSSTLSAAADHGHDEGMGGVLTWMSI